MSVTSYDAHFGIKQDALARNGGRQTAVKKMTKEEYDRFMQSPAMMKQALQEEAVAARTSKRDKKRMETDPSFKPEEADWEQAPAFRFDRRMDYYRTLGIDEYECQENVKKAYRRLSLVYHPDKTRGLDDETKEEYKQIFIEIHNAYLVLADNPTRRQYDKARDDQAIADELYGSLSKKVKQFDAFLELEKRAREKTKPAATVDVVLPVKLEKMFFGGIKRHMRARQREVFDGFVTDVLPYELVVPPLCRDGYSIMRKHSGDHHKEAKPDHLRFVLQAKDHALVQLEEKDLRLKQSLKQHKGAIEDAYMSVETPIMGGRSLLLLGRNPFSGLGKLASSKLDVSIAGQGFGQGGKLLFSVDFPSEERAVEPVVPKGERPSLSKQMVVTVKHRDSGGECCVIVDLEATFGDVLQQLVVVLGLPGLTEADFTLHKRLVFSDGLGPKLNAATKVGSFNEVFCMGVNWMAASLAATRAHEFVEKLQEALEVAEEAFMKKPTPAIQAEDVGDVSGNEPPLEVRQLLPFFGFPPTGQGLQHALSSASVHEADAAEELAGRLQALAVGEAGGVYQPPARRPKVLVHPTLRLRGLRAQGHHKSCCTELRPLRPPLELATYPSSKVEFYGNVGGPALPCCSEDAVRARPLYAVILSCHRGAQKSVRKEWAELLRGTMFLLLQTLWIFLRPARTLMPKQLAAAPAQAVASSGAEVPPMPWARMGDEALCRGDAWIAYSCFTQAAGAAGFTDSSEAEAVDESAGGSSSSRCKVQGARAFAHRSDCLQYLGDYKTALADARLATSLRPSWSQGWRRVGVLAAKLGINSEARTALCKAVELDPCDAQNTELLQRLKWHKSDAKTCARSEKHVGNGTFRQRPAKAIASYTLALAALRVSVEEGPAEEDCDEDMARLLAELHANRSGAFALVGAWELALRDARRALALPGRQDWIKGQMRMGVALLGLGRLEEAYPFLRRAELVLPLGVADDHPAKQGCKACLSLLPLWKTGSARARLARFWKDGRRRPEHTKVFAVSDIHFDHPGGDTWVSRISNTKFQEHVLIVAGNIADSLVKARICLRQLRYKFRRVFFVPGNHDLWVHQDEERQSPDSLAKLFCLLQLCDELDVDVFPAAVCEGAFIVPLLSWYNAEFDEDNPFASSHLDFDKHAKWPMDKENHVWRYLLYLNRRFLELPYPGTVLTCSHFLPRPELPYYKHVQGQIKAVGCPQLERQLRQVRSGCHVFGHSRVSCDEVLEGVRYVQCPLGFLSEHSATEPIRCVYDGARGGLVSRPQPIED